MLFLSRGDVERLLDPDELIDALAPAMADLSAGRASMPPRNFAHVNQAGGSAPAHPPARALAGTPTPLRARGLAPLAAAGGILAAMPAYVPSSGALAAKLVLVFHGNAARGLETHQAIVAVFDPDTGQPAAVMDGASITALRTAAGSALATRLCAREDATTLAIIGTGVQARSHARLIRRVRRITDVVVAGRTSSHVEAFAASIGARIAVSYEEAVAGADIVCACTNATEPVIRRAWLRPGTHVNAVGFAPGPELEPGVFGAGPVVVESRASVIGTFPNGASDLTQAIEAGLLTRDDLIEVGELVDGRRSARHGPDQITVYRSVGVAVQDAAAAMCVLRAARRANAGTEVSL